MSQPNTEGARNSELRSTRSSKSSLTLDGRPSEDTHGGELENKKTHDTSYSSSQESSSSSDRSSTSTAVDPSLSTELRAIDGSSDFTLREFSNVDLDQSGANGPAAKEHNTVPADPPPPYRYSGAVYKLNRPYRFEMLCQKNPGLMDHPSITFGGPMIVLFDIVVPCIIYYSWYDTQRKHWQQNCASYWDSNETCPYDKPEFNKDILGYAIISFGFGELYILLARVWRLFFHREECAPLLSRAAWELDATSWVYGVAMIFALIPFVVGSTMVIPELYLYGPAFLMAFLGLLMLGTLIPIPLPIGINSHHRDNKVRPFIYYAAEDFIAVDGLQDRDFRIRYNARYENSPTFRRMFVILTCWWIFGVMVYITCLSAVIWTCEFHIAFGLSLGILFAYIALWAGSTLLFVSIENKREYQRAKEQGILADESIPTV